MDFLKNNATWVILGVAAAMLALMVSVFTYLDSSFASTDEITDFKANYAAHIIIQDKINAEQKSTLDVVTTKLRHEIKQARIEELLFEKKMLLIKGDAMTDHDKKVMTLLDLEIDILNGR